MVLHRNLGKETLSIIRLQPILMKVPCPEVSEGGGGAKAGAYPRAPVWIIAYNGRAFNPGSPRILELFHTDGQCDVASPCRDRIACRPHSLSAGRTHVFHPGHWNVLESERGQGDCGDARKDSAQPGGLDILGLDACVLECLVCRFNKKILHTHLPSFAELRAAHAHYGDFVSDAFHTFLLNVRSPILRRPLVVRRKSREGLTHYA